MGYSRADDDGRALAYIGSIFFSLGLAVFAALTFSFRAVLRSVRNSWAATWPTVSLQITTCDVKAIHGRFLDYALGVIGYSYQIDDDYYSGYLTRQLWDEQEAWTFVDACKDKFVLVHCKPGKPQVSVVREIDQVGASSAQQHGYDSPHQRFGRFWLYSGLYETAVTGQRTGSTKRHKTGLLFLAQWSMQNQ